MKSNESKRPTAGVILSAGTSTRFGKPKQLIEIKGKLLIEWVLSAALDSNLDKIILVLGHEHRKIIQTLGAKTQNPRLEVLVNRHYQKGLSQSLKKGLQRIKKAFPSVMFILGDQPLINSKVINTLLDRFWSSDKDICAPVYQNKRGNPVIFGKKFYAELEKIQGDKGARDLLQSQADETLLMEMDSPFLFFDIDTEEDLKIIKSHLST